MSVSSGRTPTPRLYPVPVDNPKERAPRAHPSNLGAYRMDAAYVLARLRKIQDEMQEHLDAYVGDPGDKSPTWLDGYRAGRTAGLARALVLVGRLRRDLATDATRER